MIDDDNKENGDRQQADATDANSKKKHESIRISRHKSVPNLRSNPLTKTIPYKLTRRVVADDCVNESSAALKTSTSISSPSKQTRKVSASAKIVSQRQESPKTTTMIDGRTPSPTKNVKFKPGPIIPNTRATLLRAQANALVRRKSCPNLQDDPASPERRVISPSKFATINNDYVKRYVSSAEASAALPSPIRNTSHSKGLNPTQLVIPTITQQLTELNASPQSKSISPVRNVTQPVPFAFSGGGHSVKAAVLRAERLQKKDNEEEPQSSSPHKDIPEMTAGRYDIHGPTGKLYSQFEARTKPRSKSISTISSKSQPRSVAASGVSVPKFTSTTITLAPSPPGNTTTTSTPKRTTIYDRLSTPRYAVKRASSAHNLRGNANNVEAETIVLAEVYKDNRDLTALQPSTPIRITMTEDELTTIQKDKIRLEASLRGHQALIQWQASQNKKEITM